MFFSQYTAQRFFFAIINANCMQTAVDLPAKRWTTSLDSIRLFSNNPLRLIARRSKVIIRPPLPNNSWGYSSYCNPILYYQNGIRTISYSGIAEWCWSSSRPLRSLPPVTYLLFVCFTDAPDVPKHCSAQHCEGAIPIIERKLGLGSQLFRRYNAHIIWSVSEMLVTVSTSQRIHLLPESNDSGIRFKL